MKFASIGVADVICRQNVRSHENHKRNDYSQKFFHETAPPAKNFVDYITPRKKNLPHVL